MIAPSVLLLSTPVEQGSPDTAPPKPHLHLGCYQNGQLHTAATKALEIPIQSIINAMLYRLTPLCVRFVY